MFLLLAIPLACGWLLSRNFVGENTRYGRLSLALGLAISTSLLGVNGLFHWYSLQTSLIGTLFAQLLVCLLLVVRSRFSVAPVAGGVAPLAGGDPPPAGGVPPLAGGVPPLAGGLEENSSSPGTAGNGPGRGLPLLVWLILGVIYFFTASQQIANPDDDFWIHAPLQGLMRHGNFPPTNPFFSEIPMNGHYGRNLSLVTIGLLSGLDNFFVQHLMTCLIQMLTFVLLFRGLEVSTGSRTQALLGSSLIYFGINVGGRGGLMDTLQNNNAYVHLFLALYFNLLARRNWLLAGLTLGGYAIVYETHYGLCVLASIAAYPWRMDRATVLALAISVPLAVTQGGPITNIVQRKLSGKREVEASTLSKGMQNQAQVVKLKFPKEKLMQILLEPGQYQRESYVYSTDTFLHYFSTPSEGRGYRPIWSWDVLKLHFLPLYLSPVVLIFLVRRRNWGGLWFFAFGAISFFIPALVDFGPIYESEYFRWEFAAGLGLAGALGVAVGQWFEEIQSREGLDWTYDVTGSHLRLTIREKGWAWIGLVLFLWLATVGCGQFLRKRLHEHPRLLLPNSPDWLQQHTVLDFLPVDWEAARWLEPYVKTGDRLLTNFRQENNFSILFESTLTCVCGARCVGHALPLDDELIGTTPFHRAAPAEAFWKTGDPHFLEQLKVDWLYIRPEAGLPDLNKVAGLELVHQEGDRRIYRFHPVPAPRPLVPQGVRIENLELPAHSRAGEYQSARLRLSKPAPRGVLRCIPTAKAPPDDTLEIPVGDSADVSFAWVAPHEEGKCDVTWEWVAPAGQPPVKADAPAAEVRVDFAAWLQEQARKPLAAHVTGAAIPNGLVQITIAFPEWVRPQTVLAAVAPVHEPAPDPDPDDRSPLQRGEVAGTLDWLPGVYMQRVNLPDLRLNAVLPGKPGKYRLDVFLSPHQGKLVRFRGPSVEVKR